MDFNKRFVEALVREVCIAGNPGRHRRRGGWAVKPRQYKRWRPTEEDILCKRDLWEWDTTQCPWYSLLHASEDSEAHHYREQFRQKFGIPRAVYDDLLACLSQVDGLREGNKYVAASGKARGKREPKPLCIKLLACLYYLSSGTSFRKLEEVALMSEKVLRRSFWRIVEHMVDTHYHEHVYFPRTEEELCEVERRFAKMGMPGAFSDVDGVQLAWHACPSVYSAMNTGKEGYPTLGFLEFVGPNGEVQHIHGPEPGVSMCKPPRFFGKRV